MIRCPTCGFPDKTASSQGAPEQRATGGVRLALTADGGRWGVVEEDPGGGFAEGICQVGRTDMGRTKNPRRPPEGPVAAGSLTSLADHYIPSR